MLLTRRRIRRTCILVLAITLGLSLLTAPPSRIEIESLEYQTGFESTSVSGAFHVHTNRSDGSLSVEEIAAIAADVGLSFVVFTDHGDGIEESDLPAYHSGVLCIGSTEISTDGGHYIAVDLPKTPYPLGGQVAGVVEDVERLGGFGVIAHPGSKKSTFRWDNWDLKFDAMEWFNVDSEWRNEPLLRLVASPIHYLLKPSETIAQLLDRPVENLLQYDRISQLRNIVMLPGADTHGAIPLPVLPDARLPIGGSSFYKNAFRAFTLRVEVNQELSGTPILDGQLIIDALRKGRAYTLIDALASPGDLQFTATSGNQLAHMGERIATDTPVQLDVRVRMPPGGLVLLKQNGETVAKSNTNKLTYVSDSTSAVFRVEVMLPEITSVTGIPWIMSNPIYIGEEFNRPENDSESAPIVIKSLFSDNASAKTWQVEHEQHSRAAVNATESIDGSELALRYALSSEEQDSPFAALVQNDLDTLSNYDRIRFSVRGDRPHRVSVQLRASNADRQELPRWQRSIYAGKEKREVVVRFKDMEPVGRSSSNLFDLNAVNTLLVVVDTVNTAPGSSGVIWLNDVQLEGSTLPN